MFDNSNSPSRDGVCIGYRRFLVHYDTFEQRRGVSAAYYSDCGINFVGAESELSEAVKKLDQSKITEKLSIRQVEWHFNPPGSPHFGGAWESLVKSAKRALFAILNNGMTSQCYSVN